jgi:LysM repeat protein
MVRRSRARYLAPIALLAVIAVTYFIVHAGLNPKTTTTSDAPALHLTPQQQTQRRRTATTRFYIVKSGDNLTAIAVRTGISVGTIESLNPGLNPDSLQTGQRLRLRH